MSEGKQLRLGQVARKLNVGRNTESNYRTNLKRLDYNTKDEVIIVKNYYKKNIDRLELIYL